MNFQTDSIYESYKPTIWSAVQLLKTESEFKNLSPPKTHDLREAYYTLLEDALKYLTGTATTKDTWEIKQCVSQLIPEHTIQQETLVHVISILNVTRYEVQVNRQKLNDMMDALQRWNDGLYRLFNNTKILTQCIRYQQMHIYMCDILAYLRDSLTFMRQVAIHKMDYVDEAMTNILSPDILPVEELRSMLRHIESELPSAMHLPISSDDTLHFHQYVNTHQ